MTDSITPLFGLYTLTPGRRIYAMSRVRPLAEERSLDGIVKAIDVATAHDRQVLELDARRQQGPNPELPSVRDFDIRVDQSLSMIERLTLHYARREGEGGTASMLSAEMFPLGLSAHTRLPQVEQLSANARVLSLLESETYEKWLAAHGFEALIEELRENQAAFVLAMKARDAATSPTFKEVKQQRALGQELYLKVLVLIVAEFLDEPEVRAQLLEPMMAENSKVQVLRRRRRTVPEVDPDTGELLDDSDELTELTELEEPGAPDPS